MKNHSWLYIILSFLLGISLTLFFVQKKISNSYTIAHRGNKLNEVLWYIQNNYLDTVDENKLLEDGIRGMLLSLDPHSVYATPQENQQLSESLDGSFDGIGIQFNIINDTIMVIATVSGGPSEKVGIRAGDRIVSVNDSIVAGNGITNEQVFKLLRGPRGSKLTIGIQRPGFPKIYSYQIIRDIIPTNTLDVAYMLTKEIGYIKLNQFGENTYSEFLVAITRLKKQGMQSLVLDLRGNSGGYLGTAINLCDEFLPDNDPIVYTEGLRMAESKIFATQNGTFEKGKLVVLIDEFSASASEIVAGAVQDNDRGTIIGRRSFGKGLVQQQFTLSDNSTLRLTVARYHTPSGRCIQRTYDGGTVNYYEDLLRRYENGEMDNVDSIKLDKSLKYTTKLGRTVYGGGGIMPDYFVPLDRDTNVKIFDDIYNSGLMIEFTFDYATQHKVDLLRKYETAEQFVANMVVKDDIINNFLQFYRVKGHTIQSLNASSKRELQLWLKALIGRNIYKENGFYPVINSTDKTILKAIEVIQKKNK